MLPLACSMHSTSGAHRMPYTRRNSGAELDKKQAPDNVDLSLRLPVV